MKRPNIDKMQRSCDDFNNRHPIGATVLVWTGLKEGPGKIGQVRDPGAYILSGHTPVVFVTGTRGCVALTHVAAIEKARADG